MKLLVTGSRNITSFDLTEYISPDVTTVISCGDEGVDLLAVKYADSRGIPKLIFKEIEKESEAQLRYDDIVMMCDSVLIIWDGQSQDVIPIIRSVNKHTKPVKIFLHRE